MELVTIIIPTYNRPHYLKEALDSSINQTYESLEIIVIDDSSNLDSEKICSSYGNKIQYFHRDKKEGLASAYNFGLKNMRGNWYKVMSDDNILNPDCIETLMRFSEKMDSKILYSDYVLIDEQGETLGFHKEKDYDNFYEFAAAFWKTFPFHSETLLIHKSCFEVAGYYDQTETILDYDWALRACLVYNFEFFHVPKVLIKSRLHSEQYSWMYKNNRKKRKKHKQRSEKIRNKIKIQMMERNPEKWELFHSYLKKHHDSFRDGLVSGVKIQIKKIKKIFPYNVRLLVRRIWYKKIKSFCEVKCKICKIRNVNSFVYFKPGDVIVVCQNCLTHFKPKK